LDHLGLEKGSKKDRVSVVVTRVSSVSHEELHELVIGHKALRSNLAFEDFFSVDDVSKNVEDVFVLDVSLNGDEEVHESVFSMVQAI